MEYFWGKVEVDFFEIICFDWWRYLGNLGIYGERKERRYPQVISLLIRWIDCWVNAKI